MKTSPIEHSRIPPLNSTLTRRQHDMPLSAIRVHSMVLKALRDRIASGHYRAGEWLPTERVLSEDLEVDRRVVRSAINQLVRDGLVDRQPHCRPVVSQSTMGDSINVVEISDSSSQLSPANFVALIMWHGGQLERQNNTSQQRIFWGINQALADFGYHAVFLDLGQMGAEEDNAEREAVHLQYVKDRGFGGAIFYPYAYRNNLDLVREFAQGTPLVMIDRNISPLQTDFVGAANYQAMFDNITHLVKQGHRRIAYATKYEQILPVQARSQGYLDAVRSADIPEIILHIPSNYSETNWAVVDSMFRMPADRRPTAVAAFNDHAASDIMVRLDNLGLSVPGDVALTGFDNIVPVLPNGLGLTTIAQPYEEIGRNAALLLLRRLKDPSASVMTVELPGSLIVRGSSSTRL